MILLILVIAVFILISSIPLFFIKQSTTTAVCSSPSQSQSLLKHCNMMRRSHTSTTTPEPNHTWSPIVKNPTIMQNPTPKLIQKRNEYIKSFYNFTTHPFTSDGLYSIKNSYILFNPSDLIQRSPLYNLEKQDTVKSILLPDDIETVGKIVTFLKYKGNNVGAYVDVCSLKYNQEDLHLLNLSLDTDYNYVRILPESIEYLPEGGEEGKPTENYIEFIKLRISQIKRCGFDFVQLGNFDPFSIFDYSVRDEYFINPTLDMNECCKFILDILEYAKSLDLKICLSEFPRIFEDNVHMLKSYVDYIGIYTIDPRTFIKPESDYIKYFSTTPIFLTSHINDNTIPYFIYNTNWPIENSIIYESKQMSKRMNTLPKNRLVVGNRYINWSFTPKKNWKQPMLKIPDTIVASLPITLPLMPIPELNPPKSMLRN